MYVRPAERSHISGPNVLISASLVVVFFETVPAALLLTLAWLEAGYGLAEQGHSRPPRAGYYLQPPFWLTSVLTPSNEANYRPWVTCFNYACFFFFFFSACLFSHAQAGACEEPFEHPHAFLLPRASHCTLHCLTLFGVFTRGAENCTNRGDLFSPTF